MDKVAYKMCFTEISLPRRAQAKLLASQSQHSNIAVDENWQRLVIEELENLDESTEVLIITGSLYFIAEVRQYLLSRTEGKKDNF